MDVAAPLGEDRTPDPDVSAPEASAPEASAPEASAPEARNAFDADGSREHTESPAEASPPSMAPDESEPDAPPPTPRAQTPPAQEVPDQEVPSALATPPSADDVQPPAEESVAAPLPELLAEPPAVSEPVTSATVEPADDSAAAVVEDAPENADAHLPDADAVPSANAVPSVDAVPGGDGVATRAVPAAVAEKGSHRRGRTRDQDRAARRAEDHAERRAERRRRWIIAGMGLLVAAFLVGSWYAMRQGWIGARASQTQRVELAPAPAVEVPRAPAMRRRFAEPRAHPQAVHTSDDGRVFVTPGMDLQLRLAVSPDADAPTFPLTVSSDTAGAEAIVPLVLDGDGQHTLRHSDGDGATQLFNVFMDGTPPEVSVAFTDAERATADGRTFFGAGLRAQVRARDGLSGVDSAYASVNGAPFEAATAPVALVGEGEYSLRTYATDRVGNAGEVAERRFVVDLTPPETEIELVAPFVDRTLSPATRVRLPSQDALSGVADVFYWFDDAETAQRYTGEPFAIGDLGEGEHTLNVYAVDAVGNDEPVRRFEFYFDRTSPETRLRIEGDQSLRDGTPDVSERTRIVLEATDNKVDVQNIRYIINGGEPVTYERPFGIPQENGLHTVRFTATDDVANTAPAKELAFFMDLDHPLSVATFSGPQFVLRDTLFISRRTLIRLEALDGASGVQNIDYTVDGSESQRYTEPVAVNEEGFHVVRFRSFDEVNNEEVEQGAAFIVDNTPPEIHVNLSTQPVASSGSGTPVHPQFVQIFLGATDAAAGVSEITYRINGSEPIPYAGAIGDFELNTSYVIQVRAVDHVMNEAFETIRFAVGDF